jgi:hypothetical protein
MLNRWCNKVDVRHTSISPLIPDWFNFNESNIFMEKVIQKLSSCFKNQQGELISNFLYKELKNENIKKQTSSVGSFQLNHEAIHT